MSRIQFTEQMNEVTGLGGFYERCVRAAILGGASWLIAHSEEPFDAETLQKAIFETMLVNRDDGTKGRLGDELTTTQMGLVLHHLRYIAAHGWDEYQRQMTAPMKVYR